MQHAYASLNKAIATVWGRIVGLNAQGKPNVPIVFDEPPEGTTLPDECLRVYWLTDGGSTGQPNEQEAMVQLDIYVPKRQTALARSRAAALNEALGFNQGIGEGCIGRYDWTTTPVTYLSEMTISAYESSWVAVPDPKPGIVHLARTLILTYFV